MLLRLFGRHKLVVGVASVLTALMVVFSYVSAPPAYRASGSVVLFLPPPLPDLEPSQPARGNGLQNPFLRFNDMSVVVDILVRVTSTAEVERSLAAKGVNGTYTIGANLDFYRGPIIDVVAEARDPGGAREGARFVMAELSSQLQKLQTEQGTDPSYQIRSSTLVSPDRATTVLSSTLRRMIAASALGVMFIVGATVLADVVGTARSRRRSRSRPGRDGDDFESRPTPPVELREGRASTIETAFGESLSRRVATEDSGSEQQLPQPLQRELVSDGSSAVPGNGDQRSPGRFASEARTEPVRRVAASVHPYLQAGRAAHSEADPAVDERGPLRPPG